MDLKRQHRPFSTSTQEIPSTPSAHSNILESRVYDTIPSGRSVDSNTAAQRAGIERLNWLTTVGAASGHSVDDQQDVTGSSALIQAVQHVTLMLIRCRFTMTINVSKVRKM